MSVLITQPCAYYYGELSEHTKRYVAEQNAKILLCNEYPTNTEFFTPAGLLGDPNTAFSEMVAAMLAERNILSRSPVLDENGKQKSIMLNKVKSLLWDYAWADGDFSTLDEEKLLLVGWDLRRAYGFFNVHFFSDEVPEESDAVAPVEEAGEVASGVDDSLDTDEDCDTADVSE